MATFILVHGACHAAWCWERIVPLLKAGGHHAIAPDLPGMGKDRTPLSAVSMDIWADFVADIVCAEPEPVVLVGHSRGGIVISCAAERASSNIRGLVYLTALLLPDGTTMGEAFGSLHRDEASDFLRQTDGGLGLALNPDVVVPVFYNSTPPYWAERAKSLVEREPAMSWQSPVRISAPNFGAVPRAYIECQLDNAVPLDFQRSMQRDMPCAGVWSLNTDHSPFYSDPGTLSYVLTETLTVF